MPDDLAGRRTGERIQILRERRARGQDSGRVAALAHLVAGDTDGALTLARDAAALVEPRLEDGGDELRALTGGYHHPWTMFGASNVKLHAVSISADLSRSAEAHCHAEQIDPEEIPSRERRGRLAAEIARAYHQQRDYLATLHWLEQAGQTAIDSVRYSPSASVCPHELPGTSRTGWSYRASAPASSSPSPCLTPSLARSSRPTIPTH